MTRIGPLNIRNPVILASCLRGDTPENLRNAYETGAGAVVTKSVTLEPRAGHPEPNFIRTESGGWLNCIGLRNPGAAEFARMLGEPDYPVIVSLAGARPAEFASMIGLFGRVAAFELNLSCPNVDGFGDYVGHDPALTGEVVRAAKSATAVPVFVKIAHDMVGSAAAAVDAGADGITAINSVPATAIDIRTRRPKLSSPKSGLSGPPIKGIALSVVGRLSEQHGVPVMGCGGVSAWEDAAEFMSIGAAAVQVGSAAIEDPNVLGEIASGLSDWERSV